jgi:hypothetical protein
MLSLQLGSILLGYDIHISWLHEVCVSRFLAKHGTDVF